MSAHRNRDRPRSSLIVSDAASLARAPVADFPPHVDVAHCEYSPMLVPNAHAVAVGAGARSEITTQLPVGPTGCARTASA